MLRTRFSQSIRWLSGTGALALLLSCWVGVAAHGEGGLDSVIRDGATREAIEALARNEAPIRDAALLVSSRPDLVVQVEGIRSWTSRAFEQILDEQPEEARDDLWELVRYPELVDAMVEPGAQGRLEEVVATHPADVRASALAAAQNSWDAVLRIHRLQGETDDAVNEILDRLEPELANALGLLVDEPAALSVLAENLNLTVALGEAYEADPATVRAELSQLAADVALADQGERRQWAQQLENDPSLRAEVDGASDSWQNEYGAADDFVPTVPALRYLHPYPYWYGYPHYAADFYIPAAHAYSLWYPRSYWGHRGYYYGAGHTLVVFSAPSFPFLHWLRRRNPQHRAYSTHRGFGRLRRVGYWDGYDNRRHHAHQYRQHRPNQKAHHTRSRWVHHRTEARRHRGLRPERSFNERGHRRGRHSLGRGEARRYDDRRTSRDRRHREAREQRGGRGDHKAHDRRDARDRGNARDHRETRDRREARDRRETRDRRGERDRVRERKARKSEKRRTRERSARGNEQRRARGETKRSKRDRETKPRVAKRESRAGETRQRRAREREPSRAERRARGKAQRRIARPAPAKREKPRAQRSRGNSPGRAVSPRPAKKERQQARQKKTRRVKSTQRARKAEPNSRRGAKPSAMARSVSPNFGRARPAKAQQAQRKQKARGNQRAKAKRRKGGRSERKRR